MIGIQTEGLERVALSLRRLAARHRPRVSVSVGYSADHALKVHEDLTMRHSQGQAKFLEQPARQLSGEMASIVHREVSSGQTLTHALGTAGNRLLEESQKLVPVDTGALKRSAFVRIEEG